jgi:hypothetical protein
MIPDAVDLVESNEPCTAPGLSEPPFLPKVIQGAPELECGAVLEIPANRHYRPDLGGGRKHCQKEEALRRFRHVIRMLCAPTLRYLLLPMRALCVDHLGFGWSA